jgi:hypothetical protein
MGKKHNMCVRDGCFFGSGVASLEDLARLQYLPKDVYSNLH